MAPHVFHIKREALVEKTSQLYRDFTDPKTQSCMHQLTNAAVCTNVTWHKKAIVHASITQADQLAQCVDIVNYDIRRIDLSGLQLALTCCLT